MWISGLSSRFLDHCRVGAQRAAPTVGARSIVGGATQESYLRALSSCAPAAAVLCASLLFACGGASNTESTEAAPAASDPAAAQPAEPATVAELFPEGPGRSLVLDTCGTCHAVACSAIGQRTAARWDSLQADHREKVPNLSEEDLEITFAYLKQHFDDSKPEPSVPPQFLAGGCTPF